eukprot:gene2320-4513_t
MDAKEIAIEFLNSVDLGDKVANFYPSELSGGMQKRGKFIWFGEVSEIDNSNNPFVDQFINGKSSGPIDLNIK